MMLRMNHWAAKSKRGFLYSWIKNWWAPCWRRVGLIFCVIAMETVAGADTKDEVFKAWDSVGRPFYQQAIKNEFISRDGVRLRYTIFAPKMKTSIPVVISPGMGETGLFYTETAYHLSRLGLGPFFVIDHRGNGFSQRFIDDLKVVHLDRFQSMVDDYTQFIQEIVIPYLNQKKIQAKPLSLSHSMGSAVNAIALEQESWLQQFYRSAIFYSPMFKINFLFRLSIPWEGKRHSLLSLDLNLFDQKPLSWLISELKDWAPRANILGQGAVPVEFDPNNRVTSSEGHWLLRQRLENEFGEALVVEHVTNGWMGEAIQAAAQARDSGKSIRLPCLVIGAENDDLVLSSGLKEFVAHSPRAQLRMISHSKHAIHLENRPARRSLMRFIETMAHQEKHFSWAHINGDH